MSELTFILQCDDLKVGFLLSSCFLFALHVKLKNTEEMFLPYVYKLPGNSHILQGNKVRRSV